MDGQSYGPHPISGIQRTLSPRHWNAKFVCCTRAERTYPGASNETGTIRCDIPFLPWRQQWL